MYKKISVKNFKCFDSLSLNNLKRINLIAGKNNVGKTALLESLFIHSGQSKPELALRINAFRGMTLFEIDIASGGKPPWENLFYKFDIANVIEIDSTNLDGGRRLTRLRHLREQEEFQKYYEMTEKYKISSDEDIPPDAVLIETGNILKLESVIRSKIKEYYLPLTIYEKKKESKFAIRTIPFPPPSSFHTFFITSRRGVNSEEDAKYFSKIVEKKEKEQLIDNLQEIDSRIKDLSILHYINKPFIYCDIGENQLRPIIFLGDGLTRILSFFLFIANAKDGIVLVDEVENGIHYSVMKNIWRAIFLAAESYNVQIFATTHSRECAIALYEAFRELDKDDFTFNRLEFIKDRIEVKTYDLDVFEAALETNLEFR